MAGGRGGALRSRSIFETFWANASYKSFAKPNFRNAHEVEAGDEPEANEREDIEAAAAVPLSNYTSPDISSGSSSSSSRRRDPSVLQDDRRAPSARLTGRQLLYIAGSHGVGAMIISGGINFALAYAMYTTSKTPIRLFELPNTLVGDTAVTVIVQTIMTWFIEMLIVNMDLRKGSVQPIGFLAEPGGGGPWVRFKRWFLQLDGRRASTGGGGGGGLGQRLRRGGSTAVAQAARALVVAVVCFPWLFGPSVGVLIAVGTRDGGDWDFDGRWAPEVFKLVLGATLALLTTPLFATYWMVRRGWELKAAAGGGVVLGQGAGRPVVVVAGGEAK